MPPTSRTPPRPNEPGIPGIPVQLERSSQVSAASVEGSGGLVKMAASTMSTTTNAFGFYSFPSVEPGAWQIVAKLTTDKLEQTSDTGGVNDWIVPVMVPVNGVGIGDFAAAGNKQLSGALETSTGEKITCGEAQIIWSGIDGVLGTADDAVFQVKLNGNGEFLADGVPGGPYRISGSSCSGKQAAAKSVDLVGKQANVKLVVSEKIPVGGSERNKTLILILTLVAVGFVLYPKKWARS